MLASTCPQPQTAATAGVDEEETPPGIPHWLAGDGGVTFVVVGEGEKVLGGSAFCFGFLFSASSQRWQLERMAYR